MRELGVYELGEPLGAGAMGCVYRALHRDLHRPCALKVLTAGADDPRYLEHFREEGRAAAQLVHPHVVTIHAIGEVDGRHYLEMELLEGGTLRELARRGPPDPLRAMQLAAGIADGLSAAHESGIVHRDVKGENALLGRGGTPKLVDFGLAKRVTAPGGGELSGTPDYMAPELFLGGEASPASDVYALGVLVHLLLTGRYPYPVPTLAELIYSVANDPVPVVEGVGPRTQACVASFLAKDPAERPADGAAAFRMLTDALVRERDFGALLGEAFSGEQHVSWEREGDRFAIVVELPDGRTQRAWLEPTEDLLLVYSTCCRADPRFHEEALRLNARLSHGAVALRDVDGAAHFVVLDSFPRATVDVEAVRRAVVEVAGEADAIERRLTGRDRH